MTVSRDAYPHRHLTRRGFIQTFAAVSAGLALSVACGQQASAPAKPAESKPAEAPKPTEAAKPAAPAAAAPTTAPAAAAPAATTAPAAAKPTEAAKPAASASTPAKGSTIRVGLSTDTVTMDPHLSGSKTDRQIYNNVYEKLVDLDNKLQIIPGLAESWSYPDPQTLILKLRQGVKFHDGTDFNADVVKFNFERMKNPDTKSLRVGEIANVDHVEVVDPYTAKLVLKRPDASLLATLTDRAGMMLSPAAVQKFGPDFTRNPVGTGPFQFVEWVKDDHLALKKFDGYWDKAAGPYLDGVRYRPIPDDTVKLQSLVSGEIDAMDYVQPRDVAQVKGNSNLVEVDVPSLADFGYYFNTTRPPFDNKSLRLAVAYAIDVTAIVKGVWLDVGVPANGPIPPSSWAYDSSIKPVQRDLAKAKQFLADGGKSNNFTFTLVTGNTPITVQEAEAMKGQLAEAGITMEIQLEDPARLQADQNARNFDLTSSAWSGRPDPDGNTYQFFHTTPGISSNVSGYSNPQMDELLEKTRATSDQGERKKLYSQLVQMLRDEMPRLEMIHPIEPKAFSPKVQNYDPVPDGMMRFKNVWLKS